ncbi:MAG: 4Fe-4S binding protein [Noviherbaspirillum sp.]
MKAGARFFVAMAFLLLAMSDSRAGVMTRDLLVKAFPAPFTVGQREADLPVWPIYKQNATANELVAYVFESIDFAAVPGFSGVPVNLLIALDPKGNFVDVLVVSHHEPVFLDGLGEQPLFKFVSQYSGMSLLQNIAIDAARSAKSDGKTVHIDGVAKATASVRIINQSVLGAALKVARKKLGYAGTQDPDQIAQIKKDHVEQQSTRELIASGLVTHLVLKNADVERAFADSDGAGLDEEARTQPDAVFLDLYLAYVSVPGIGRNLLTEDAWRKLGGRLDEGDHALLVLSKGRHQIFPDEFKPGTSPERLILRQNGLPLEMRDLNMELGLVDADAFQADDIHALRIISHTGLDASQALEFALPVTRLKGMIYPERITREIKFQYRLPERFYTKAQTDDKTWAGSWKQRWWELALVGGALLALAWALAMQKKLTADSVRFAWFRRGFLAFTVLFIGWYAQGQLSIVNLTGLLQALKDGRSLAFFLYDPVSLVIWAFVLVTLFIWGRGTFCGWLCPFGALQEFSGKLGSALGLRQLRMKARTDARLRLMKYLLLAAILGSALISTGSTDQLVEIEPFKTAITLNFMRSWPFVVYAAGLLVLSAFSYKFFCRYLCPLGAGLALLGRFRLLDWIPRRQECGTPCQTCRYRCDYGAIRGDGRIRYDECFQCMDCVVIYNDDRKCAPLVLDRKRQRVIPVQPHAPTV